MPRAAKKLVLRHLYEMLGQHVPLGEAWLATLGGEGVEAQIWRELGVDQTRAWLVDCSPRAINGLLKAFRGFRIHQGRLELFSSVARGVTEALDAFHLDANGTAEAFESDLEQILPLILNSRGRMLAVTVSDTRRSPALHDPEGVKRQATEIFGDDWASLWQGLVQTHQRVVQTCQSRSLPEDAALREVATLMVVYRALASLLSQLPFVPVQLERFIYISAKAGQRMRTYIFHFAPLEDAPDAMRSDRVAKAFAQLALSPPLTWVREDQATPIPFPDHDTRPKPPAPTPVRVDGSETGDLAMARPKKGTSPNLPQDIVDALARIDAIVAAGLLAPAVIKDVKAIVAHVRKGGTSPVDEAALREEIKAEILASLPGAFINALRTVVDEMGKSNKADPSKRGRGRPKKTSAKLTDKQQAAHDDRLKQDRIRLEILRAKAKSPEAYAALRTSLAGERGWQGDEIDRRLGATMAYAHPDRCKAMVARLLKAEPEATRVALAEELSKLIPLDIAKVWKLASLRPPRQPAK